MRDADVAEDLRPEADHAVDAPVADADEPERSAMQASPTSPIATSAAVDGRTVNGIAKTTASGGQRLPDTGSVPRGAPPPADRARS